MGILKTFALVIMSYKLKFGGEIMSEREEKFEKMLQAIQNEYSDTVSKMEKLRLEDKTKTVTYKQLMGTKVTLQNMLSRYEIYGLLE